ncbi:MAG: hypothetical protein ACOCUR_03155, partial [Nanoarchaeota archaeon]
VTKVSRKVSPIDVCGDKNPSKDDNSVLSDTVCCAVANDGSSLFKYKYAFNNKENCEYLAGDKYPLRQVVNNSYCSKLYSCDTLNSIYEENSCENSDLNQDNTEDSRSGSTGVLVPSEGWNGHTLRDSDSSDGYTPRGSGSSGGYTPRGSGSSGGYAGTGSGYAGTGGYASSGSSGGYAGTGSGGYASSGSSGGYGGAGTGGGGRSGCLSPNQLAVAVKNAAGDVVDYVSCNECISLGDCLNAYFGAK